jgi:lyso-ornithine lipid O-acyltransferase
MFFYSWMLVIMQAIIGLYRVLKGTMGMLYWIGKTYYMAVKCGALHTPRQPQHTQLIEQACQHWVRVLGISIKLHAPMPTTQGLWVANHVSWVDGPVLGSHIPAFFIGRADIAKWPVVGRLVAAGGTFFVNRGTGDAASISTQVAQFIGAGNSVLFFPEATTTDGRRVYRMHSKMLQAAVDSGKHVQPVLIMYQNKQGLADTITPWASAEGFISHFAGVLANDPVTAHVQPLAAISPAGHNQETLRDAVQAAFDAAYQQLYTTLYGQPPAYVDAHWEWDRKAVQAREQALKSG